MSHAISNTTSSPSNVNDIKLIDEDSYSLPDEPKLSAMDLFNLYSGYMKMVDGRHSISIPLSQTNQFPAPCTLSAPSVDSIDGQFRNDYHPQISDPAYTQHFGLEQGLNCELIPGDEIRSMWDQVIQDNQKKINDQMTNQTWEQMKAENEKKNKKLALLLQLALNSGNLDLAILLFSSLESQQANQIAGSLLMRVQELQQKRSALAENLGKPTNETQNSTSDSTSTTEQSSTSTSDKQREVEDQKITIAVGNINTEISMLQTFLQDVNNHKNESQTLASNWLKSRHDTAMGILRNV